jgi:hypothetical protein
MNGRGAQSPGQEYFDAHARNSRTRGSFAVSQSVTPGTGARWLAQYTKGLDELLLAKRDEEWHVVDVDAYAGIEHLRHESVALARSGQRDRVEVICMVYVFARLGGLHSTTF